MLTLFSIPKPFTGESDRLQWNAIRSWRALAPDAEIILLGKDAGVAEAARETGALHLPDVELTEWGTPRVDDIFAKAESAAKFTFVCYINADIILTSGFFDAVKILAGERKNFLAVSQRWDLNVPDWIEYADPAWERKLLARAKNAATLHSLSGIDFFLYRKGLYKGIPPFGVGRTMWDNWLIYGARAQGAMVVDVTPSVWIIHQNHGYAHHPGGYQAVWKGPEAEHNLELAGGLGRYFTIEDATHRLVGREMKPILDAARIRRRLAQQPVLNPIAGGASKTIKAISQSLYSLRVRIAKWRGRIS